MSMRSRTLIALVTGAIFGFSAAIASGVLAEGPRAHGSQAGNTMETVAQTVPSGQVAGDAGAGDSSDPAVLPWQEARLFAEVYEHIKRDYVDRISDHKLMDAA